MFCPNCGMKIADQAAFCPNCGKAVAEMARAQVPYGNAPAQEPQPESGRNALIEAARFNLKLYALCAAAALLICAVIGVIVYFVLLFTVDLISDF